MLVPLQGVGLQKDGGGGETSFTPTIRGAEKVVAMLKGTQNKNRCAIRTKYPALVRNCDRQPHDEFILDDVTYGFSLHNHGPAIATISPVESGTKCFGVDLTQVLVVLAMWPSIHFYCVLHAKRGRGFK